MENMEQDHLSEMDIKVDEKVRQQLYETSKWTKFISIVIFIVCGLMLLVGVIGGTAFFSIFNRFGYGFLGDIGGAIIFVIVLIVVVTALVYYFLFDFSRKINNALVSESVTELNAGLKSLKVFFIITTVFAILSLLNTILKLFS